MSSSSSPLTPVPDSPRSRPHGATTTGSLTPPPSLSPPLEGFAISLNQRVQSSLPATPYNIVTVEPPQPLPGTFGSALRPSDDRLAQERLLRSIKKSAETHIKVPVMLSIQALVGEPLESPESDESRLECECEVSLKDIFTNGGVDFGDTRFQRAISTVFRSRGRRLSPSLGVYQTDIALLISSCDFASKLKSSNSARSLASAVSAKRKRLHQSDPELSPNGPYFCAVSLIVEVKTNNPWAQYCQTVAYVLQAHERCGCRLGIAFHNKVFSRIFAVDANTCLVEMNDRALVGTVCSIADLASSRLRARDLYQHNLKSTSSEGRTILNPEAFQIFSHIVKSAATVLYRAEMTRVPHADELSGRAQQILNDQNVSSLRRLRFESRSATTDADYLTLVRKLRPVSSMPDLKEDDKLSGSDDDQGDSGGADGRQRKTTRPSLVGIEVTDASKLFKGVAGASSGAAKEEEQLLEEDPSIEDDISPVSLTEAFRGIQAVGVKFILVSGEIMTAAVDLYRDGKTSTDEAASSGIKSGIGITRLDQSLSQEL